MALRVLSLLLISLAALRAQTAQLDGNKALFTILAAVDAVGYGADVESPSNHPLRRAIRDEIVKKKLPVVLDLRDYFRQHRQDTPLGDLRLLTSWALLVTEPPAFEFKLRDHQMPPDVLAMRDLGPLLARFYKDADIDELWHQSQPVYEEFMARYHAPATQAVTLVSAYLRTPMSGAFYGRKFQVVAELMGPPNQILFLPFFDQYYLVVTNSLEVHAADVRQAYIHYLIDPLVTQHMDKIDDKKGVGDYAQGSPLPEIYKSDFLLLATKSLVKAIEVRLERGGAAKRQAMVDQAMKEGYVLTAHFAEQLPLYEKQEQAMRFYFPELITSINLSKEEKRLENFEFAAKRVERIAKTAPRAPEPEPSEIEKALEEAEKLYGARKLEQAREAFAAILTKTDARPMQARAYYGLGRIATLNRDPESAERMFHKTLDLGAPPHEKAWTLVYLGKLSQAARQDSDASSHFQAALAVEGGSEKAKEAAKEALRSIAKKEKQ